MRFDSLAFFAIFAVVYALHLLLPWGIGRFVILIASYVIYGAYEPSYCVILFLSSTIDFAFAYWIFRTDDDRKRKYILTAAVITNLSWLAAFKYSSYTELLLPVGISFYTFQSLSYIVDVYRRRMPATKDFPEFLLYVSYFPQLVAGPIERGTHLLPQLRRKQLPSADDVRIGIDRILVGLFKKCVLADRLSLVIDPVYAAPATSSAGQLLAATVCFAFQLYWDFSGYTDIAIGLGRLMGVHLSENFARPFVARDPSDWWKRWHITLTTWFRDYLGHALTKGERPSPARNLVNVIIIMTLIGVWHGAQWNFVLFGVVSGIELAVYNVLRHRPGCGHHGKLLGHSIPGTAIALIGQFCLMLATMPLFRARSLDDLKHIYLGVLTRDWTLPKTFIPALVLCALGLAAQAYGELWPHKKWPYHLYAARWLFLIACLTLVSVSVDQAFIYYQF